jgi:hypothetical protein
VRVVGAVNPGTVPTATVPIGVFKETCAELSAKTWIGNFGGTVTRSCALAVAARCTDP